MKSHIGELTNSKKCPECGRKHDCSLCDDWHYCDCGYWWSQLNGEKIDRESFPKREKGKGSFVNVSGST